MPSEISLFFEHWISHPEYWFNKTYAYDKYISLKYQHLLTTNVWDKDTIDINYHLSFIILYDQVPRHIYRSKDPDEVVTLYLDKALELHSFVTRHFDLKYFNATEWIFFNLPIRHSQNANNIIGIIHDTWKRIKIEHNEDEINRYLQFLKASYSRFPKDTVAEYIEESVAKDTLNRFELKDFVEYIDILSNCPFVEAIGTNIEESEIYYAIEDFIVKNKVKHLIMSLSGGVDSMVCSYILKKLEPIHDFQMVAVHIDYCNRTFKEYQFVRDWCIYMKIPMYTRHITEINRKDCMDYGMRALYEDYTRTVRFDTYKDVWDNYIGIHEYANVILGHNYDDCFENILTNISNRDKYENLIGMSEEQTQSNIRFMRPILNIQKKDIYVFAYKYHIPYLHDSTPDWSQRGKIRDIVRPALDKWCPSVVPAFFDLSAKLSEYEDIVYYIINDVLLNVQKERHDNLEVITCTLPSQRLLLSTTIWKKIFEKLKINISNKSLHNLIKKVEDGYMYHKKTVEKSIKTAVVTINKNTNIEYSFENNQMHIKVTVTYCQF